MLGIADWCIIAVLAFSSSISLLRGFVKEALSLFSWVAAFAIALVFSDALDYLLTEMIAHASVRYLVAFAILFIGSLILFALLNKLITTAIRYSPLRGIDRLLGVVFGLVRGVLVLLVALIFIAPIFPVQDYQWWHESILIPELLMLEDWFRNFAEVVRYFFSDLMA